MKQIESIMKKYGSIGVSKLKEATPKDTGTTSESWSYTIKKGLHTLSLEFNNSNIVNGYNVAVLIDVGHGTRSGGYVRGARYIHPVINEVVKELTEEVERTVFNNV